MSARIAENVKNTILELIADLREAIFVDPSEQGDLLKAEFFFQRMGNTAITDHVVTHVLPHKDKIVKRDAQFFLDQKEKFFSKLPADRVDHFASMVKRPESEGGLSDDDRSSIWRYFDALVILAEQYKKTK